MAHYSMVSHFGGRKGRNVGWRELISNIVEQQKEERSETMTINIGGEIFKTNKETFKRFPDSRLGQLDRKSGHFDQETHSYFFDRNPILFRYIIDYYKTGELHIPLHICPRLVEQDLEYWGIKLDKIKDCCRNVMNENVANMEADEQLMSEYNAIPQNVYSVNSKNFSEYLSNWKLRAWELLDDYRSSKLAKIWHIGYMFLVVLSVLSFFVGSVERCRVPAKESIYWTDGHSELDVTGESVKVQKLLTTTPHPCVQIIELSCLIFFTVELIFRFVVCPWKKRLLKKAYTFFDVLYIVPAWIVIIVEISHCAFWRTKNGMTLYVIIESIEIFRVLRIFRFMKHHRGLRVLYLALKNSSSELLLLLTFVAFNTTIFASLIYCTEAYSPDYFQNAFQGMWWSLITMTTVGYGDMYPQSLLGYVVGGMCALIGIIMIQMPIPIIVSNFHAYYGLRLPETHEEPKHKIDVISESDHDLEDSHSDEKFCHVDLLSVPDPSKSPSCASTDGRLGSSIPKRDVPRSPFHNKVEIVVESDSSEKH